MGNGSVMATSCHPHFPVHGLKIVLLGILATLSFKGGLCNRVEYLRSEGIDKVGTAGQRQRGLKYSQHQFRAMIANPT